MPASRKGMTSLRSHPPHTFFRISNSMLTQQGEATGSDLCFHCTSHVTDTFNNLPGVQQPFTTDRLTDADSRQLETVNLRADMF